MKSASSLSIISRLMKGVLLLYLQKIMFTFRNSKMKKNFHISLLFFLPVLLCSCPYSSPYNLDEEPGIYVEDALLGKWMTYIKRQGSGQEEAIYLNLNKNTDTEYNISFTGNFAELLPFKLINSDSLTGTAFMSTVVGRQFFNIKINSRIYIAELILKNEKLSLLPLAEHFTGKMILNTEELRKSVDFHYKTRAIPVLDDDFCLRDMIKLY
jgi:hypothetical protein